MNEIKNFVEDLGIASLEANTKIAGIAVVSDSGNVVYQTKNLDLTSQTSIISNVIKGDQSFVVNNIIFKVIKNTTEGIIGTNEGGMGHMIFVPFQGGVLVVYAMSQADPANALHILKPFAIKLNDKL